MLLNITENIYLYHVAVHYQHCIRSSCEDKLIFSQILDY